MNETELSIEIEKAALNASMDKLGADLKSGQVLQKRYNSLSIPFYNLVSFIRESGVHPFSWKQNVISLTLKNGRKADNTIFSPIASLSTLH